MKFIKSLLITVGLVTVICWIIGAFVPGVNYRSCLGPADKCLLAREVK